MNIRLNLPLQECRTKANKTQKSSLQEQARESRRHDCPISILDSCKNFQPSTMSLWTRLYQSRSPEKPYCSFLSLNYCQSISFEFLLSSVASYWSSHSILSLGILPSSVHGCFYRGIKVCKCNSIAPINIQSWSWMAGNQLCSCNRSSGVGLCFFTSCIMVQIESLLEWTHRCLPSSGCRHLGVRIVWNRKRLLRISVRHLLVLKTRHMLKVPKFTMVNASV